MALAHIDGADALGSDLEGFVRGFGRCDHFYAVGGGVGHGLFAVDGFAGADGVDNDLFVPVIRDGG